jgi:hypothetical protein
MGLLRVNNVKARNFDHIGRGISRVVSYFIYCCVFFALPIVVWRCTILNAPLFLEVWKPRKQSKAMDDQGKQYQQ